MESALTLTKAQLESLAGFELGYGRTASAWSDDQKDTINAIRDSALRRVYVTEAVPQLGIPAAYGWSFLRPRVTITLASGAQTVDLPDDCGGVEGRIRVAKSGETNFVPMPVTSAEQVRLLYGESPAAAGRPQVAAIEWLKDGTLDKSQRQRLVVYPEADAAYNLEFQYYLLGEAPRTDRPYPYGGAAHAELYKAAILAQCEFEMGGQIGDRNGYFMARLAASIEWDQKAREQYLGFNADNSDERFYEGRNRRSSVVHGQTSITFGGVEY